MPALEEMREEVIGHQFSENRYDDFVDAMLNEAQIYIARQVDMRELEENTGAYVLEPDEEDPERDIPEDFMRIRYVVDRDRFRTLIRLSRRQWDELDHEQRGHPTHFTFTNREIFFWPFPDAVANIELLYYRQPESMEEGDEPEIPENYHHLLVSYALDKCFRREHDFAAADFHRARFEEGLMKMKGELPWDSWEMDVPQQVEGLWSRGPAEYHP